jgi:hypothetical protein
MNRPILSLAATLALVGGSHAAVLVDNFESYSPLFDDMNGQGGWTVSNGTPLNPLDGPVVIIDNYTWDASTQSATVGGVEQTFVGVTSLYHSVSVPFQSVTPMPSSFKFETAYTESTNGFRNSFQFVLGTNVGGGNLLTINLTPGAAGQYDVSWNSGFAAGGPIGPLVANTSTQFQLDTYWNGSAVAYNFSNAGSPVSSGTFATLLATDVMNGLSVNWDSSTGAGVGNNSITIDNVSLVPEPTSAMLGLMGASFAFLRRRRA